MSNNGGKIPPKGLEKKLEEESVLFNTEGEFTASNGDGVDVNLNEKAELVDERKDIVAEDVETAVGEDQEVVEKHAETGYVPGHGGLLSQVMDVNFLQYASYVICSRAIPTVEDGLKPVQRRILHSLFENDDGRFVKVATVVGNTMSYHPHGDASIFEALVNLENKHYLIEGQGNFGNLLTGAPAAAGRYIECRLTALARNEIFNPKTTNYIPNYDGRKKEPTLLASKLPILLMHGADGIAVGLSTKIFPHNFIELLEAQIALIEGRPFTLYPDFATGGYLDVSEYDDGIGRIKSRAKIETSGNNEIVITELPYGQTSTSLVKSINDAIIRKKLPIKKISDLTADTVNISLVLSPGANQQKVIKSLYAFTNCEVGLTANTMVIEDNKPCEKTVSEILRSNVKNLQALLKKELEISIDELMEQRQKKTLVQIFIEERIYKRIEQCKTNEEVKQAILDGFEPFKDRLFREITPEDIEMLLSVPIRRISLYDMSKNRKELEEIALELDEAEKNLKSLKSYTIRYLKGLIKKYQYEEVEIEVEEEQVKETKSKKDSSKDKPSKSKKKKTKKVTVEKYPRYAKLMQFDVIDVRAITSSECTIMYDKESGYLGTAVKTGEELFKCSSLDKLIVLSNDGKFMLIPVPEKQFVDKNLILCEVFNRDTQYTAIYTESDTFTKIKRFAFGGLIMNKEYNLLPDGGVIRLLEKGTPEFIWIKFKQVKNLHFIQKIISPEKVVAVKGVKAGGKNITAKAIQYVVADSKPPRWWDENANTDRS